MFNVIGLYDVKFGDTLIGDHINGQTLTKNAIIAKIDNKYQLNDVTVIKNDQRDHIKLGLHNLGQNLLDVLKPKKDDVFERAELLYKICQNNDIDIYNDIIELNIKNMIKHTILKDISALYQKTLDTTIQYSTTYPTLIIGEEGIDVSINQDVLFDDISTNKKAKSILYKIAKRLEKDDRMQTGPYIQKYKDIHKAFVEREKLEAEQEQNTQTLTR